MPNTNEKFIVRILDHGEPVGAGFLVSLRHIITCAHVIRELDDEITLDFPLLSTNVYRASVKKNIPVKENPTIDDIEDIAVLELLPNDGLPDEAIPAPVSVIENTLDQVVHMYGFPARKTGRWVSGKQMGLNDEGRIQIVPVDKERFLEEGFSGSAVWDDDVKAVVGMVVVGEEESGGIYTGYMIPASKLAKAWPELGSKAEGARETESTVGRFSHKMCNRDEQVREFAKFFDCHTEKIISGKKPPQIYIIHGSEDECHDSLVERFQFEKIRQFNKIVFNDTTKPVLESLALPFDGNLGDRKDMLTRKLFNKLFGDDCLRSDCTSNALRDSCIGMDLNKHRIIMLLHNIEASKWNDDFKQLIKWYINDFWAGFGSSEDTPQFMIFLNVKYPIIEKTGFVRSLINKKPLNKKIEENLDEIQRETKPPCLCLKIKELPGIEPAHVTSWYSDYMTNVSDHKKLKTIKEIFLKKEKLCMADVEEKLEEVVKSVSPRII